MQPFLLANFSTALFGGLVSSESRIWPPSLAVQSTRQVGNQVSLVLRALEVILVLTLVHYSYDLDPDLQYKIAIHQFLSSRTFSPIPLG